MAAYDAIVVGLCAHGAATLSQLASRGAASCLYTTAPRGDFLTGSPPESPRVLVASARSGHGFNDSAALGEMLAHAALEAGAGPARTPAAFAPGRFAA